MATKDLKQLKKSLGDIPKQVDSLIQETLLEYANKIMAEIPTSLVSSYALTVEKNRVIIWTENEIAAYIEFGTGQYATNYLSSQPQEVREQAIQFYVSGDGTMPANPYLFPAYFKYRDEIVKVLDQRIQELLDRI